MLFDPERKLPAYITKLTGIRDADLRGQDTFSDHATKIEEFLGDALIVGHNVMFDIGFVNAELRRAGRMPLINDRVDTMALAMRYLPDLQPRESRQGCVCTRSGTTQGASRGR